LVCTDNEAAMQPKGHRTSQHSSIQLSPGASQFTLSKRVFRPTLLIFAGLLMANAAHAQSQGYSDGIADRTAYENWFATLDGQEKAGAEYWADQRSAPNRGPCTNPGGNVNASWVAGCREAHRRLDPSDARRHSEPEYRLGWNAFQEPPPATAPQAPSQPASMRHPAVRDTAALAADGQTYMLDGVQGLGAPYADQLQAYIIANGDSVSCKPRGAPGYYVCVLGDGTDVAQVALVNGAARAAPDAPDPYYQQQLRAYAARRGIWASLPPSPLSVPSVARPGSDALSAAPDTLAVQPQAPVRAANREPTPTPTPSDYTTGQSIGLLAVVIIVGIYLQPSLLSGSRRSNGPEVAVV
jgi:hypothetical protein